MQLNRINPMVQKYLNVQNMVKPEKSVSNISQNLPALLELPAPEVSKGASKGKVAAALSTALGVLGEGWSKFKAKKAVVDKKMNDAFIDKYFEVKGKVHAKAKEIIDPQKEYYNTVLKPKAQAEVKRFFGFEEISKKFKMRRQQCYEEGLKIGQEYAKVDGLYEKSLTQINEMANHNFVDISKDGNSKLASAFIDGFNKGRGAII